MARHGENIRKRKDGRWEGRYKVFDENKDKYTYRSVYGSTYEEVKEKLSQARFGLASRNTKQVGMPTNHQIQRKSRIVNKDPMQFMIDERKENAELYKSILFSQAAKEWLKEISKGCKPSTYVKYDTVYKTHLAEIVGDYPLSAAAASRLQEKIFNYVSGNIVSESLQKSICCVVNQILAFANKKHALNLPQLEKTCLKPKKKTVQTLSRMEQSMLLTGIYREMDKFKIAVLLCLYTGLRLGELCALQWTDLDMNGMTLSVNRTVQRIIVPGDVSKTILLETDPKSESSKRIIPLTDEIIDLLCSLKGSQAYVFGSDKPLEPRTMQYRFKKMLREAEMENKNFHILRHTFATNCVENGMDVKSLSEILGHSDVKITLNRYIHPTMCVKRKYLGLLLDFYGQICGQAA